VVVAVDPAVLGNDRFTIGVEGAPAGAEAVLVVDAAEPPASGGVPQAGSFARVTTVLASDGRGGGFGSATLAIPNEPERLGQTLFGRWYVNDPAAAGGVASSPSFRFTVFGQGLALGPVDVPAPAIAASLQLAAGVPNPFTTRNTVRFALPSSARARLAVYDVTGRAVRRLYEGVASAGTHLVEWDGRDDAGRVVPGGVYFYRLDAGDQNRVARVIRLD
jgi:hypothetical protein